MRVKTSELSGAALDWAVAKCEGEQLPSGGVYMQTWPMYSTEWRHGGPIIEQERIMVSPVSTVGRTESGTEYEEPDGWRAARPKAYWRQVPASVGGTPLVAAMRCYVASKLGDEVDVPEELLT